MNISGIRSHGGYQANNSISEIELQALEEASRQVELERQELDNSISPKENEAIIIKAREQQTFGAAEYAGTYQPNKEYPMKGLDSDIRTLDVEKALSEMQKDRVIQQYQFFVGDSQKESFGKAAAPAREIEDFTL